MTHHMGKAVPQMMDMKIAPVAVTKADFQIMRAIFGRVGPHSGGQPDVDVRMCCTKGRDLRCQNKGRIADGCVDPYGLFSVRAKQSVCCVLHIGKRPANGLRIGMARIGQRNTAWQPFEQLCTQMLFQQFDLLTDCGRGEVQLFGSGGKVAIARGGIECP